MRKSQMSLFIIIVVILVLILGIFTLIPKGSVSNIIKKEMPSSVSDFVESCMQKSIKKSIETVENNGGYIDTNNIFVNPLDYTESDGIFLVPNSNLKVPYWFYMKSDNNCLSNCLFTTQEKPLCKEGCEYSGSDSIEEEIEKDSLRKTLECIDNFKSFNSVKKLTEPKMSIKINENEIIGTLNYKIDVNGTMLEKFEVKVPTVLYSLYKAADVIRRYEQKTCFLEEKVFDFLSFYMGFNSELPPIGEENDKRKTWMIYETHKKADYLTTNAVQLIRYYNSSMTSFVEKKNDVSFSMSNRYVVYPFNNSMNVIVSSKFFPWFSTYFNVYPNDGSSFIPKKTDIPLPKTIKNLIPLDLPYNYDAKYMYSFPVFFQLYMKNSINEFEHFNFAMEGNIRNNHCFREGKIKTSLSDNQKSLLCDKSFWTDRKYKFYVVSDDNNMPVDNASIYFYAGSECYLGNTDENGMLETNIPITMGGSIKVEKEGFIERTERYKSSDPAIRYIRIKPIYKTSVNFKVIDEHLLKGILAGNSTKYDAYALNTSRYTVTGAIRRVFHDENAKEEEISSVIMVDNTSNVTDVKLTRGEYELSLIAIDNVPLYLPAEHDRNCVAGSLGTCMKTPVDPLCWPHGKSQWAFEHGDCYKKGYTCENRCVYNAAVDLADDYHNGIKSADEVLKAAQDKYEDYLKCLWPLSDIRDCDTNEAIDYDPVNMSKVPIGGIKLDESNGFPFYIRDYDALKNGKNLTVFIYIADRPDRIYKLKYLSKYINVSNDNPRIFMPVLK